MGSGHFILAEDVAIGRLLTYEFVGIKTGRTILNRCGRAGSGIPGRLGLEPNKIEEKTKQK